MKYALCVIMLSFLASCLFEASKIGIKALDKTITMILQLP